MFCKPIKRKRRCTFLSIVPCFIFLSLVACITSRTSTPGQVRPFEREIASAKTSAPALIILQINDVYEILPVEAGASGGLARVASLKKELIRKYPDSRVVAILAGDFVSPSALNLAVVDGKPLAGRQMIAALNAMGMDYVRVKEGPDVRSAFKSHLMRNAP